MPRKSKEVAVQHSSTALSTVDQQLKQEISNIKETLSQPGGNRISIKQSGFISPDGMDLGNELQMVIVDYVSKNMFYDRPYDPQNPSPPACYAAGKVIAEMAPDKASPVPQNKDCATCPMNQFGSAANGKGKACKNTRELVVLLPDEEGQFDPSGPLYTLSVPPTGLRAFDGIAANIARTLAGPPIKAIVTATVKDAGTYGLLSFVDPVANPQYADHFARREEAMAILESKPDFTQYVPNTPRKGQPVRRSAR